MQNLFINIAYIQSQKAWSLFVSKLLQDRWIITGCLILTDKAVCENFLMKLKITNIEIQTSLLHSDGTFLSENHYFVCPSFKVFFDLCMCALTKRCLINNSFIYGPSYEIL